MPNTVQFRRSQKQNSNDSADKHRHLVTFVIITKNRPRMVIRLIRSVIKAKLNFFSLVLIDDSDHNNFLQTNSFLQSLSTPFKQFSSRQAVGLVEENLKEINLPEIKESFIRSCAGIHSPFCGYVERFLGVYKPTSTRLADIGLRFAPYSSARNLGIFCAVRFFDPEAIFFLDDDCLIIHPDKLGDQIRLIETRLNQRRVVAVAGLYKDLHISSDSEKPISRKAMDILRGMERFLRESFTIGETRFEIMPPHMLGGALVLAKEVFRALPFDPYVARGEDHAYALDLWSCLGRNKIVVRDNDFRVGHQRVMPREQRSLNVLRDIFRFIYIRAKTGRSFITFFSLRWGFASLIGLVLKPSNYRIYKDELWALLFVAPKFTKENASKFGRNVDAWKHFLRMLRR
jgi:glycosyltransferase involved in cell wall biosynthesis